jgi:hypothetical protein
MHYHISPLTLQTYYFLPSGLNRFCLGGDWHKWKRKIHITYKISRLRRREVFHFTLKITIFKRQTDSLDLR